jgi:hypothetical protein
VSNGTSTSVVYGEAVTRATPDAIQVADRWLLMENASAAFLDAVRRSMRGIRTAIGATTVNPVLLTFAERLRYQGYLRRQKAYDTIAPPLSATKYRSKRPSVGQGAAATLSARSVEAWARTSSELVTARSTGTCRS